MLIVAVDIGGTFTDFLGYDTASGRLLSAKAPTTPAGLEHGVRDCLKKGGASVVAIDAFVHGSTIAINTVLERKGARTALVVTKGTRDVYKIGRGNRPDAYDIWFKRPEPLVPRHLTFEERLLASGEVHTPLNVVQAESVAKKVSASGAEAVAVCFLHSWNNPIHESHMARLLNSDSKTYRSISHEIVREYGEYERISTTVLNSYIGPKVSAYLKGLERLLQEEGFGGKLWIMQSNGGVMSSPVARRLPVAMLESGPVGGFIAAARIGRSLGYPNVIGFDMGGTTAKASPAPNGEPQMSLSVPGPIRDLPVTARADPNPRSPTPTSCWGVWIRINFSVAKCRSMSRRRVRPSADRLRGPSGCRKRRPPAPLFRSR